MTAHWIETWIETLVLIYLFCGLLQLLRGGSPETWWEAFLNLMVGLALIVLWGPIMLMDVMRKGKQRP